MHNYETVLEHAKQEIELIGLTEHPVGIKIIELLVELSNLANKSLDQELMYTFGMSVPKLCHMEILTPLFEDDFKPVMESNTNIVARSKRNPYVYKTKDGKYIDERAITFTSIQDPTARFWVSSRSSLEVTLPYIPNYTPVPIDTGDRSWK
jgi:hypothetical protein